MKRIRLLAVFNFLVFIVLVGVSYATNYKMIGTATVEEVSRKYESLFTPADNTFVIWGVIYTALFAFCVYHLIVVFTKPIAHPANQDVSRLGAWFIVNNLATIGWLFTWTSGQLSAATILIILQLITLMAIHIRLGIHDPNGTVGSKIFTYLPLSIYFGWITIATIANISIYLVATNWDGFGWGYSPVTWTQFVIGLAVLITIVVVLAQRNVFYGLVIIWALWGIKLKLESINPEDYSAIIQTAWIGMGVTGLVCLIQFINNLTRKTRHERFLISREKKGRKAKARIDRTVEKM
jgi:hypothetical protein